MRSDLERLRSDHFRRFSCLIFLISKPRVATQSKGLFQSSLLLNRLNNGARLSNLYFVFVIWKFLLNQALHPLKGNLFEQRFLNQHILCDCRLLFLTHLEKFFIGLPPLLEFFLNVHEVIARARKLSDISRPLRTFRVNLFVS